MAHRGFFHDTQWTMSTKTNMYNYNIYFSNQKSSPPPPPFRKSAVVYHIALL